MKTIEKLEKMSALMKTIEKLEGGKLEGNDVSLETSLIEYGLAWHKKANGITFVYGTRINEMSEFIEFETYEVSFNDLASDFASIDFLMPTDDEWKGFLSFTGCSSKEAFHKIPLELKVTDLIAYFGTDCVFGDGWQALTLEEVAEKFSA